MRLPDANFLEANLPIYRIAMARSSRADDVEERLVEFATDIVTLIGQLRNNKADQASAFAPPLIFHLPSALIINH